VNGIFAAIGAPAYFVHSNDFQEKRLMPFTLQVHAGGAGEANKQPRQFAFTLERFRQSTIDSFTCVESPAWDQVRHKPMEPCWCFVDGTKGAATAAKHADRHFLPAVGAAAAATPRAPHEAGPGTVAELYTGILHAIETIPEEVLFTGTRAQVEVLAQYDIFVTPVTGRRTAKEAIKLILFQGEGNLTDPEVTSHFSTFFEIRTALKAMKAADARFEPALAMRSNPRPAEMENPFTRHMLEVSNYSYGTLLLVLTAVYNSFVPTGSAGDVYPHFSEALYESVFAPMMTMVIRKQGEILSLLPTGKTVEGSEERAGPGYDIPDDVKKLLEADHAPELQNIDTFVARFEYLTREVEALLREVVHVPEDRRERVRQELEFLHQNAFRMTNNLKHVYQDGKFANF
jgi:hypothetical protein